MSQPFIKEVKKIIFDWSKIPTGTTFSLYDTDAKKKVSGVVYNDKVNECVYFLTKQKISIWNKSNLVPEWYEISFDYDECDSEVLEEDYEIKNLMFGKIDPSFKIIEPIKVGSNKVEFRKGEIKVGCTTVSNETVTEIYKRLIK